MESDTPRTDAKDWMWTPAWAHPGQPLVEEERVVDAKFARQLERELAAAIKQRDGLLRALEEIANQDYRGNGSNESLIAQRALAAMRKGESDGK
jgi:hypothetical protein